ncbi:MAG: hypothetical protein R6X27_01050 [Candidatus Desulfacyla sp.]
MADAFQVPEAAVGNRPDESFVGPLTTRVPVILPEKGVGLYVTSFPPSNEGGDLIVPFNSVTILPSAETLPEKPPPMESLPHDPETEPETTPPVTENVMEPEPSPEKVP